MKWEQFFRIALLQHILFELWAKDEMLVGDQKWFFFWKLQIQATGKEQTTATMKVRHHDQNGIWLQVVVDVGNQ